MFLTMLKHLVQIRPPPSIRSNIKVFHNFYTADTKERPPLTIFVPCTWQVSDVGSSPQNSGLSGNKLYSVNGNPFFVQNR